MRFERLLAGTAIALILSAGISAQAEPAGDGVPATEPAAVSITPGDVDQSEPTAPRVEAVAIPRAEPDERHVISAPLPAEVVITPADIAATPPAAAGTPTASAVPAAIPVPAPAEVIISPADAATTPARGMLPASTTPAPSAPPAPVMVLDPFGERLLAALRQQFGGHEVKAADGPA